jgi:uncharacterized membrane protein
LTENATCALAYFTFIPAIVFLAMAPYNQSAKVRFHCWQSIFLSIVAIVVDVCFRILIRMPLLWIISPLFAIIGLAFFVLWLIVVLNTLNGKMFKVPVIADLAARQARM